MASRTRHCPFLWHGYDAGGSAGTSTKIRHARESVAASRNQSLAATPTLWWHAIRIPPLSPFPNDHIQKTRLLTAGTTCRCVELPWWSPPVDPQINGPWSLNTALELETTRPRLQNFLPPKRRGNFLRGAGEEFPVPEFGPLYCAFRGASNLCARRWDILVFGAVRAGRDTDQRRATDYG